MPNPIITLRNVSWSYARSGLWALKNINLEIGQGECIAVMGANGSGKTTFCKLLNGIIPHSQAGRLLGTVTVDGLDTAAVSVPRLSGITGMALDDPDTQLFTARVRDEIAFGPENLLTPPDETERRVNHALEIAGLSRYADFSPAALSGGQKQRLVIAAALAMAAKIVVLDESSSQLDPEGARGVLALIHKIRQESGLTVIITTHNSEEAAECAGRICVLKNGKMAACAPPTQILSDVRLLEECGIKPTPASELAHCLRERGAVLSSSPALSPDVKKVIMEWINDRQDISTTVIDKADIEAPLTGHIPQPAVIQIDHLYFSYNRDSPKNSAAIEGHIKNTDTLDNINLVIYENDFIAVAGQNGSGKTTLLKNVCGLLRPDRGTILVRGKDSGTMSVAAISAEIGFVMQNPDRQLFAATVYEEVAFALENAGLPEDEIRHRTQAALEPVGLWEQRETFPPALSRGDRARTVIAAVLAMGSKIIIMDEPSAGQDYLGCRRIMAAAQKLHKEGYTVIFVTHNMALAAGYARRIIVMKDGRILMDGRPAEVFARTAELAEAGILPPPVVLLAEQFCGEIPLEPIPLTAGELADRLISCKKRL
ncbi:MAG: ATP-binding cassette domain-containing protein [Treponema sp.]|jgi:energy-coupling factor transport system ATP-binding protein|nr:ATP-binding cassette domain-containing protein [Treponema sp.]